VEGKCYNCDTPGHTKKNCLKPPKGRQVVKEYALDVASSSSKGLTTKEKRKSVITQGTLSIRDVSV